MKVRSAMPCCRQIRLWPLCIFVVTGVLISGCGRASKLPPLAEVSGTVTLDGVALPGARLEFIPDASKGTGGPPALGVSDETGRYELTTLRNKGAAIGFHRVKVTVLSQPKGGAGKAASELALRRYSDPKSSGFAFEVKKLNKGESNVFDLPLKSAP